MNKRGAGETITFIIIAFVMTVALSSVYIAEYMFAGDGYAFKKVESQILAFKIIDCLQGNHFLSENFDFYGKCNLNNNIEEDHLIQVIDETGNTIIDKGVSDYKTTCYLDLKSKDSSIPECYRNTFVKDGVEYSILVGSNENSRRVVQ